MAAEKRGVINTTRDGHGTLCILIYHGKSFPGVQLENLGLKSLPHLRDNSIFFNNSLFLLIPIFVIFMHYMLRILQIYDFKSESSREE